MTALQFVDHRGPIGLAGFEQDGQVIDEVGRFRGEFGGIAGDRGERDFDPFLADLLREALDALADQSRGVAGRGVGGGAVGDGARRAWR